MNFEEFRNWVKDGIKEVGIIRDELKTAYGNIDRDTSSSDGNAPTAIAPSMV